MPCGHVGLSFSLVLAPAAGGKGHRNRVCPLRVVICALRARRLFFSLVLAACAACGKAGPVMGLRPLLGPPCIPPEAPPLSTLTNSSLFSGAAMYEPRRRVGFGSL